MSVIYTHSFETDTTESGYYSIQQKVAGRGTLTSAVARLGTKALSLRTAGRNGNPPNGDNDVAGSGFGGERCDLSGGSATYVLNSEFYLAHSLYLPDTYNLSEAATHWYLGADMHQIDAVGTQALFHVDLSRWDNRMHLRAYGGPPTTEQYNADLGAVQRNVWYDFVHHLKLHPTAGIAQTWLQVNGGGYQLVNDFAGPTIYNTGSQTHYWKFSNYHETFDNESVVIHDRIVEGSSFAEVAISTEPPASGARFDDFNRANTTGGGIGSPSDGGPPWVQLGTSVWDVNGNAAMCSTEPANRAVMVLQHNRASVKLRTKIIAPFNSIGLIGRCADDDNYLLLYALPTGFGMTAKVAGTYNFLNGVSATVSIGDIFEFWMYPDNTLECYQNGIFRFSSASSAGASNTKHGINSDNATTEPRFDFFEIHDIADPPPGTIALASTWSKISRTHVRNRHRHI